MKILQEGNPWRPGSLGLTQLTAPPAVSLQIGRFCLQGSIIPAREKEISVPAPPRSIPSFSASALFVSVQGPCLEIWDAGVVCGAFRKLEMPLCAVGLYRNPCACPAGAWHSQRTCPSDCLALRTHLCVARAPRARAEQFCCTLRCRALILYQGVVRKAINDQ